MKNQSLISSKLVFCLFIILVAGGCGFPASEAATEGSLDAVYTIAAQTVIAHYTQEAVVPTSGIEPPVDAPTITPSEPTQTTTPTGTQEPTSTLTQTEIPNQTSVPDTILEDDFSNPSLWYVSDEDDFGFEYQDGRYRIYNKLLNAAIWSIKYQEYEDIRVEVDASRQGGPEDGYYGVICRFDNDGNDYYALVINDLGFYGILKMEDGELDFLETGMDENEIIQKDGGETNRIQGVCVNDQLILYANDQKLIETVDDTLIEGVVGLVVGNRLSGTGIDVTFDNFTLVWP